MSRRKTAYANTIGHDFNSDRISGLTRCQIKRAYRRMMCRAGIRGWTVKFDDNHGDGDLVAVKGGQSVFLTIRCGNGDYFLDKHCLCLMQ